MADPAACDIAIIGGGPVGAALALALADSALTVCLLEAGRTPTSASASTSAAAVAGSRPIAVSAGSRQLLQRLNAWHGLRGTPVMQVHVSQRGSFGCVTMSAAEAGVAALAHVIDYPMLAAVLRQALNATVLTHAPRYRVIDGARVNALAGEGDVTRVHYTADGGTHALAARIAVLADGGDIAGLTPPRTREYGQSAITACVRTQWPHHHTAYERFTTEGPLALLPFGNGADDGENACDLALVWTVAAARADELMQLADTDFLQALGTAFGSRLGTFVTSSARACHALSLRYHPHAPAHGVIAIGNAAQTLHPVAGQGFNLGLRDAWQLATLLRTPPALPAAELARRFHAARQRDRSTTIAATHGLVQLFSNDHLPLLRSAGMTLLAALPPLKDLFARQMMLGVRD